MSYSSSGSLFCNPFIYWGNIQQDWVQFVRRIDPRDYLRKARYIDEFTKYLDRVEFFMDGELYNDNCDSLDWGWFFSRHGMAYHSFSIETEYWFGEYDNEILFPLSRNKFPFHFLSEGEINEIISESESHLVTREAILKEIPESLDCEEDLEKFVRDNLDIVNAVENLCVYNIKISSPEPKYCAELENRNFDEHMGLDALLAFLARAGVVNEYFRDWMLTCHMMGEDGEEFAIVRKIAGNKVIDPNQRNSSW